MGIPLFLLYFLSLFFGEGLWRVAEGWDFNPLGLAMCLSPCVCVWRVEIHVFIIFEHYFFSHKTHLGCRRNPVAWLLGSVGVCSHIYIKKREYLPPLRENSIGCLPKSLRWLDLWASWAYAHIFIIHSISFNCVLWLGAEARPKVQTQASVKNRRFWARRVWVYIERR